MWIFLLNFWAFSLDAENSYTGSLINQQESTTFQTFGTSSNSIRRFTVSFFLYKFSNVDSGTLIKAEGSNDFEWRLDINDSELLRIYCWKFSNSRRRLDDNDDEEDNQQNSVSETVSILNDRWVLIVASLQWHSQSRSKCKLTTYDGNSVYDQKTSSQFKRIIVSKNDQFSTGSNSNSQPIGFIQSLKINFNSQDSINQKSYTELNSLSVIQWGEQLSFLMKLKTLGGQSYTGSETNIVTDVQSNYYWYISSAADSSLTYTTSDTSSNVYLTTLQVTPSIQAYPSQSFAYDGYTSGHSLTLSNDLVMSVCFPQILQQNSASVYYLKNEQDKFNKLYFFRSIYNLREIGAYDYEDNYILVTGIPSDHRQVVSGGTYRYLHPFSSSSLALKTNSTISFFQCNTGTCSVTNGLIKIQSAGQDTYIYTITLNQGTFYYKLELTEASNNQTLIVNQFSQTIYRNSELVIQTLDINDSIFSQISENTHFVQNFTSCNGDLFLNGFDVIWLGSQRTCDFSFNILNSVGLSSNFSVTFFRNEIPKITLSQKLEGFSSETCLWYVQPVIEDNDDIDLNVTESQNIFLQQISGWTAVFNTTGNFNYTFEVTDGYQTATADIQIKVFELLNPLTMVCHTNSLCYKNLDEIYGFTTQLVLTASEMQTYKNTFYYLPTTADSGTFQNTIKIPNIINNNSSLCQFIQNITYTVTDLVQIQKLPSIWVKSEQSFTFILVSNLSLSQYNLEPNLTYSDPNIQGAFSESEQIIFQGLGANQEYGTITTYVRVGEINTTFRTLSAVQQRTLIGEIWEMEFNNCNIQECKFYLTNTSSDQIKIHPFSGKVSLLEVIQDFSFTVNKVGIDEWQTSSSYSIQAFNQPVISEIGQDSLVAYLDQEIRIDFTVSSSINPEVSLSGWNLSDNYTAVIETATTGSEYTLSVTQTGAPEFTTSLKIITWVIPILLPQQATDFWSTDSYGFVGIQKEINIEKCKFYVDIYMYQGARESQTINLTYSLQTWNITESFPTIKITPITAQLLQITIEACYVTDYSNQHCVNNSYDFQSYYTIHITEIPNQTVFIGALYQKTADIQENQTSLSFDQLDQLWLAGEKPSKMTIDPQTGIIEWIPDSQDSNQSFNIELVAVKGYARTSLNFILTISTETPLVFSKSFALYSESQCIISQESPNQNCELSTVDSIFPSSFAVTYSLEGSFTASQIYIDSDSTIKWDRSGVTNPLEPSAEITVCITDFNQAKAHSAPFQIRPIYRPVISDLGQNYGDSEFDSILLDAYENSLWRRIFSVTDNTDTYPSGSVQEKYISVIIPDQTISWSNGVIQWTPTTAGSYTLTIEYTDIDFDPILVVTKDFLITVNTNSVPACSAPTDNDLKIYNQQTFTLDISSFCSDTQSDTLNFSFLSNPDSMSISDSIITWTTTTADIGTLYTVQVTITQIYLVRQTIFSFDLIVQPQICLQISETQTVYQKPFKAYITLCANTVTSNLKFQMISFSSDNIPSDWSITSKFGTISTQSMEYKQITFSVTASLDNSLFLSDSITVQYTFYCDVPATIVSSGIPLSDSLKVATAQTEWSQTVSCTHLVSPVTLSITTEDSFILDENIIKWTPTLTDYSSDLVKITCEVQGSVVQSISYQFVIVPVSSPDTTPTCTDFSISIDRYASISGQIEWQDIDSSLHQTSLTSSNTASFPGLALHKWGYYEYVEAEAPSESVWSISISDSSSSSSCSGTVVYTDDIDKISLEALEPQFCVEPEQGACLNYTLPVLVAQSSYSLDPTTDLSLSDNLIEWSPNKFTAYNIFDVQLSNDVSSQTQQMMFCQGVQCRNWPIIESLYNDDGSCTVSGQSVVECNPYSFDQDHILVVKGYNFGNSQPEVYVGNKVCQVQSYSNEEIQCKIPVPSQDSLDQLPVYIREKSTSQQYYSPVVRSFSYKAFPGITIEEPPYSPMNLFRKQNSQVDVRFSVSQLHQFCTCSGINQSNSEYQGTLVFQSFIGGICTLSSSNFLQQSNSLKICCFSLCDTKTNFFYVTQDPNFQFHSSSVTSGHNHGHYTIKLTYTPPSPCQQQELLFQIFSSYSIKAKQACSGSSTIYIPPYIDTSSSSFYIRLSYSRGISFTQNFQSLTFTLTGSCQLGTYIQQNTCQDCTAGFFCDQDFSDPTIYYTEGTPCELGSYQNSPKQSECIDCPQGYQCYCVGLSSPIICDAGFICAQTGTVKRYKPCIKGNYCLPGTSTEISNQQEGTHPNAPNYCPENFYCLAGVYVSVHSSLQNPYQPQPCNNNSYCAPGSSNPDGAVQCIVGYFCSTTGCDPVLQPDVCQGIQGSDGVYLCPPGYNCPTNTLTWPSMCTRGSYQPNKGQLECITCAAGYYCPHYDNIAPKQQIICPAGSRCPEGSTEPVDCELKTYQPDQGQDECLDCPIGYYCDRTGMTQPSQCEPGSKCPQQRLQIGQDCPASYYCERFTNMNELQVGIYPPTYEYQEDQRYPQPCPLGNFCQTNSFSPSKCGIKQYQDQQWSSSCKDCPDGYLCTGIGVINPTICPTGYACIDNNKISCTSGYYCLQGTSTLDPDSDIVLRPYPCAKGTYCTGGNTQSTPDLTVDGAAQACQAGTYNDLPAQQSCFACLAGHQCLQNQMDTPVPCQSGKFRQQGLSPIECELCPQGTYNPQTGATSQDDCLPCTAGLVCLISGISEISNQNSSECSGGYYCLEGTSRATRNNNPCPAGTFCYPGTASLEEAQNNLCPAGRYCSIGTSATEQDYQLCLETDSTCTIGISCTPDYYCPEGVEEPYACPTGTISPGQAKTLDDCYRNPNAFYDVEIVDEGPAHSQFVMEALTTKTFTIEFLDLYSEADMPEDYQMTTIISVLDGRRRLSDQVVRILLNSHESYGTKQSIPLIYSEVGRLKDSEKMEISISTSVDISVEFDLQYLNGKFQQQFNWTESKTENNTMTQSYDLNLQTSFFAVITKEIGKLFVDPVNLYKYYQLDQNYQIGNGTMTYQNRFSLSFVSDGGSWLESQSSEYSTSIWDSYEGDQYTFRYLPYVADCSPGYGSNLDFSLLFSDSRCEFQEKKVPVDLFDPLVDVKGDYCSYQMICDYNQDLSFLNRKLRWYQANTQEYNSYLSYQEDYPPFYITRTPVSRENAQKYTQLGEKVKQELIQVQAIRSLQEKSWVQGEVPQKVKLMIGYYLKNSESSQILIAELEFTDFIPAQEFSNTQYTFQLQYYALSWIECFDLNSFTSQQYLTLLSILALIFLSLILVNFAIGILVCPKRRVVKGLDYVLKVLLDYYLGIGMSFLCVIVPSVSIWILLYQGHILDYQVGDYTDRLPITDITQERVLKYRAGRFGTCIFILGLIGIKWGSILIVPPRNFSGFGYQSEIKRVAQAAEQDINQGPVLFYSFLMGVLGILIDSLGDSETYSQYFYVFIPFVMIFFYGIHLLVLLVMQNQHHALTVKIGVKIALFFLIINGKTLSKVIIGFLMHEFVNLIRQTWLEKYNQRYVLSFLTRKFNMKISIERRTQIKALDENTRALSEFADKTSRLLINWLYFFSIVFIYTMYQDMNFNMIKPHFLYLIFLGAVFCLFEPVKLILSHLFRMARDLKYGCHKIHDMALSNYKSRFVVWALQDQDLDQGLPLSFHVLSLFCTGLGKQYFFAISLTAFGIAFVIFGVKFWVYSKFCPFLDYWMFLQIVGTYLIAFAVRKVAIILARKVIWKVNQLNILYEKGVDGKLIVSREDFIKNSLLQAKLGDAFSDESRKQIFLGEISQEIMRIIKQTTNHSNLVYEISQYLKQFQFDTRLDQQRIFQRVKKGADLMNVYKLHQMIEKSLDPNRKIAYIQALRLKNKESLPKFPEELLYNWD